MKLSDELDARVRHEAARRGMTISEFTREALEANLEGGGRRGGDQPRRRLSFAASGASGESNVSERIEEILREELG